MKDSITYEEALPQIAHMERRTDVGKKLDSFDRSIILTLIFDVPKEQALDDIMELRGMKKVKR
jgi:hypothetical protein